MSADEVEAPPVDVTVRPCSESWSGADLAKALCDVLVEQGKLKVKPAFIRGDREAKLAKIFDKAGLTGAKMAELNKTSLKSIIRGNTAGEAWVDDVESVLNTYLSAEVQMATDAVVESEEVRRIREGTIERAREAAAAAPEGDGAGAFGSFGGGDRTCHNCGKPGHIARECPEPRIGGGGDDRRGGRACYTCGQEGHLSRDCPQGGQSGGGSYGGGGGGGDRCCFQCGKPGHISRDCPEGQSGGGSYGGGGGGYGDGY